MWACGPCTEGTCLLQYHYDDKDCTQLTPTCCNLPNPVYVPAEKCTEQAPFNHFKIHCEGSG